MRILSSMRIVRVGLALGVGFWMAGAGCLLGCENMMSAVAASHSSSKGDAANTITTGEACASMHSHDCCSSRAAKSAPAPKTTTRSTQVTKRAQPGPASVPQLGGTSSDMTNCPLAVNAMAALSKPGQDQSSAALATDVVRTPPANIIEQTTAFARSLRLPNRGHTYLRCCTFRI